MTYTTAKGKIWYGDINKPGEFAKTQPHATYAVISHGEVYKYTHFQRTIPGMKDCITLAMI